MSAHNHDPSVPKGALFAAGGLIAITLAVVVAAQTGMVDHSADPVAKREAARATPLVSRDLVFVDTDSGAVEARDTVTGKRLIAVEAGSKTGFIRGVMRGLGRDRKLRDIGREAPFRLTRWSNGDLTLTDTSTTRTIELNSFGPDNRKSFEVLL